MYIIDRNLEPLEQCREGAVTISTFYMTAAAGPSPSESASPSATRVRLPTARRRWGRF